LLITEKFWLMKFRVDRGAGLVSSPFAALPLMGLHTARASSETQICFAHCQLLLTQRETPVTGVARRTRKVDVYPIDLQRS
jgi:hypothetical protein